MTAKAAVPRRGVLLHWQDEGWALNPQLHPWPPAPKAATETSNIEAGVEAQMDKDRASRDERLIKGGYTDANWCVIALVYTYICKYV